MTRWLQLRADEVRIIAVATMVFAFATADVLTGGPLTYLDEQIRAVVQPRPPATSLWLTLAGGLGDIGIAAGVMAIAALVCAQARWRLWPVVLAAANFAVAEGAVLLLKTAVGRPGPGVHAQGSGYPGYFPSGHTTTAAVATGTVVFLLLAGRSTGPRLQSAPRIALVSGLAVGFMSAILAVLGDFHWASDGIGGLALATVVLVLGCAATRTYLTSTTFDRRGGRDVRSR
jgi:undecaprenyl-diphosphatase